MDINETQIRDYLQRMIANKNKRLSGMYKGAFASNRRIYNAGFGEVVDFFVSGDMSGSIKTILNDMDRNPKKHYAYYNYFDIDTLYSYDKYLGKILQEIDIRATSLNRGKHVTCSDIAYGFDRAKNWIRDNANTEETGYYNRNKPVAIARVDVGGIKSLNPKKAPTQESFDKKYHAEECKRQLNLYLSRRELLREGYDESEMIPFEFMKQNFYLVEKKKDYYTTEEGRGITSIMAVGKEGQLYRTFDGSGEIYSGNIYSQDGELVEMNGGGEEFIPNAKYFKLKAPKKTQQTVEREDLEVY